jgi:pimeloyl-ACP methyl ester carboxylesterase
MRKCRLVVVLALVSLCGAITDTSAGETQIRVGNLEAFLTVPSDVEKPPVALLIAGAGSTDHDGNGPEAKPATLKKLAELLAAQKIATLRYDKRGAGGWKAEFGKPEDFRFKDYVDDAVSLVNYLRESRKFSRIVVVGHSEGGLVAILTARQVQIDRVVLLATAARRQGDLLKAQLEKRQIPPDILDPILKAIDSIMAGQIVDPPPRGLAIAPSMQPSLASAFVIDPIGPLKSIDKPILIVGGGSALSRRADRENTLAAGHEPRSGRCQRRCRQPRRLQSAGTRDRRKPGRCGRRLHPGQ